MGYLHFYSQIHVQYHQPYLKDQHVVLYTHLSGKKTDRNRGTWKFILKEARVLHAL